MSTQDFDPYLVAQKELHTVQASWYMDYSHLENTVGTQEQVASHKEQLDQQHFDSEEEELN